MIGFPLDRASWMMAAAGVRHAALHDRRLLAVFARYNHSVWPAQRFLLAAGIAAVALAIRLRRLADPVGAILAILWLWMGIAYHLLHFAATKYAAYRFGVGMIVQGNRRSPACVTFPARRPVPCGVANPLVAAI